MTDEQPEPAVATDSGNDPRPGRTLADAATELRALLRAQRARERAGRDARILARLEQQAARSKAASEAVDD